MDYLLRDAYFTGASHGKFDLTRILRASFDRLKWHCLPTNGMHAVEGLRSAVTKCICKSTSTRLLVPWKSLLQNLLKRARTIYPDQKEYFQLTSPSLIPFLKKRSPFKTT